MKIRLEFKAQDRWIGAYWAHRDYWTPETYQRRRHYDLWICLVPMLPIHCSWDRAR